MAAAAPDRRPTADPITVRPARLEDAPGLARVVVDTDWALTDPRPLAEQYAESERNWRRAFGELATAPAGRQRVFATVEAGGAGRVVGLAMGGPRRLPAGPFGASAGEVYILVVRATHQRRGLGRRLVGAVFRHLVGAGLPSAVIECLSANAPARRCYEALGGHVAGEHRIGEAGTQRPSTVYGWSAEDVAHLLRHAE
jgi:ribosomal protein S18 acetylase RimI-like enzyme